MTREELIEMAKEVGMCGMLTDVVTTIDELERFAALVAAKEREECAMVCEERAGGVSMFATSREAANNNKAVRGCAAAIRARKP